jgi:beta-glucosidase
LASTFDRDLAKRVGEMLGEDALWTGYSGFYGIGINTHRSAYDGRAFEYYSEDPVLAGEQATQVVIGIQSKGCNAYVKHIAGYEQQTNRVGLGVWNNEQTYREIYLKPFKICVEKGNAMNAMTSYTRIGVTLCPASRALCTDFLRGECGMKGFVVSDMWTGRYLDSQLINCMMAGCDLPDGDLKGAEVYAKYESGYSNVAWQMRLAAERICYATVHSNAMNGYSASTRMRRITPPWQTAVMVGTAVVGILFALSAGALAVTSLLVRKEEKQKAE